MTEPSMRWNELVEWSKQHDLLAKQLYVIISTPTNGFGPVQDNLDPHLAYQTQLEKDGVIFGAGPVADDAEQEWHGDGLFIYRAASRSDAVKLAEADPMHVNGARRFTVRPWLLNEGRPIHGSESQLSARMGETASNEARLAVREVIENWALWRDAGDWDRFATVWHSGGHMTATLFQGTAEEYIAVSRRAFEAGATILHFLGGSTIDVNGARAVAQTKMTITQRAAVDGVEVDAVCTGRFYDFFENRAGVWGIVRRQPIYEKDRLDTVDPAARLELDQALLHRFPIGYRHLGYLQTKAGFNVKSDLPGLSGPAVTQLYAQGRAWLDGADTTGIPV